MYMHVCFTLFLLNHNSNWEKVKSTPFTFFLVLVMIKGDSKRTSLFFRLDPARGGVRFLKFLRTFKDFFPTKNLNFYMFCSGVEFEKYKSDMVKKKKQSSAK